MKGRKIGFTLVELSLFLAITALLFLGVTIGVRNSIFQQRFNDSVQSFAEFLRTAYSETMNVEHTGTGASERAVYGKLLTFGETYDLNGKKLGSSDYRVFSYTVVGEIGEVGLGDALSALATLKANVLAEEGGSYKLAGIYQEYIPKWGAGIQTTAAYSGGYGKFKGSILIVRHPLSGTVLTFYNTKTIEVNQALKTGTNNATLLTSQLSNFKSNEINFCINPYGTNQAEVRRDIRIIKNSRSSSGVLVINQDGTDNKCK